MARLRRVILFNNRRHRFMAAVRIIHLNEGRITLFLAPRLCIRRGSQLLGDVSRLHFNSRCICGTGLRGSRSGHPFFLRAPASAVPRRLLAFGATTFFWLHRSCRVLSDVARVRLSCSSRFLYDALSFDLRCSPRFLGEATFLRLRRGSRFFSRAPRMHLSRCSQVLNGTLRFGVRGNPRFPGEAKFDRSRHGSRFLSGAANLRLCGALLLGFRYNLRFLGGEAGLHVDSSL